MSNHKIEKALSVVPEVYFDLIARLIPGSIAWLIFTNLFDKINPFEQLKDFNVAVLILVASYIIGFTADTVSFSLTYYLHKLLEPKIISHKRKWEIVSSLSNDSHITIITKMSAENILCRSLGLIFIFFWVTSIYITPSIPTIVFALTGVTFLIMFIIREVILTHRLNAMANNQIQPTFSAEGQ